MLKTSSLVRSAVAATAFLIAGSAFAGEFVPEIGIGKANGKDIDLSGETNRDTWTYTAAMGYVWDTGLGVRVITIADGDFARGLFSTDRSFDNFVGVQATGAMPIAEKFNLTGGLGIGRTKIDNGQGNATSSQSITDGLLSVGLQWHPSTHYAMELRVQHLTTSSVTSTSLQFQVPF
jgi:Outer membrane protein beta-barrel domain